MTKFAFAISDGVFGKFPAKHIAMRGELDESNVDKHAETMYEAIRLVPDGTYFVFDATELSYINSKGLGYLTDWYNKLSDKEGKIVLVSVKPTIFDILDVVGITQIIPVYDNLATAEQALVS